MTRKETEKKKFMPRKQDSRMTRDQDRFFFFLIIPVLFFIFAGVCYCPSRLSLHLLLSLYMSMSVYEPWLLLLLFSSLLWLALSFPFFSLSSFFFFFFNGDGAKVVFFFLSGYFIIYVYCLDLLWSSVKWNGAKQIMIILFIHNWTCLLFASMTINKTNILIPFNKTRKDQTRELERKWKFTVDNIMHEMNNEKKISSSPQGHIEHCTVINIYTCMAMPRQ